ncbi:capsule biosynthesis protein [Caminibacter sp.]
MNRIGEIKNKNILLLQGPMGDFFRRFDLFLKEKGAKTYRIGFNAGDWFFSNRDNYLGFKGKKKEWRNFIYDFLKKKEIDKIFLFGDCRYYQKVAIEEAKKLKVETYVFEEGYLRPDYVTMEKWGVNNFSLIPRDKNFYLKLPEKYLKIKKPKPTNPSFFKMAKEATIYYLIAYFGKFLYPYYEHHRPLNPYKEFFYGIRNGYRKLKYKIIEKDKLMEILKTEYFFVPLQTAEDFQIKEHSDYNNMYEFIDEVLNSFAKYAPKNTKIVIKHHPMDRGRYDYAPYIRKLAKNLNIYDKVEVVYDLHLPTLLKNTLGCVTINSTVGLQALYHNAPVKVMGDALYDIEGLTNYCTLEEFWNNPQKPNKEIYLKFRNFLIENTQINGSFYGKFYFENLIKE